jgi:2-polyprenyl-3-methyl-5-hydroxy-6-metoxy-1,4-benzoquinol methylase
LTASSRYSIDISLDDLNTSHALGILSVPPGSFVLDVGAADGSVARQLVERGCRVVGIEIDPEAAAAAERYCERVVVGDIDVLDLNAAVPETDFDVVLLLDVLEHLRHPVGALKMFAERAKPDGRLIISLPNVTHAALRLQLLSGRFQYTDKGLLDRTHLHFFDRPAVEQLIAEAGLTVLDRMRTSAPLTATEIPIEPGEFPAEAVALASSGDDADTYQFIYVCARGAPRPASASLTEVLQRKQAEAERLRNEAAEYTCTLEARVAELTQLEADAHERSDWLERELRGRLEELERVYDELAHAKLDLAVKDGQLAHMRAELSPVPTQLYNAERALGHARYRMVHRVSSATKRVPVVHRGLKRVRDSIATRKR